MSVAKALELLMTTRQARGATADEVDTLSRALKVVKQAEAPDLMTAILFALQAGPQTYPALRRWMERREIDYRHLGPYLSVHIDKELVMKSPIEKGAARPDKGSRYFYSLTPDGQIEAELRAMERQDA